MLCVEPLEESIDEISTPQNIWLNKGNNNKKGLLMLDLFFLS